jgi:hypothetical protein
MAWKKAVRTAMLLCIAAAVAILSSAGVAGAAAQSDEPAQAWVTDGSVYAVAATPGGVYIGGSFGLLGRPTGSWVALSAGSGVMRRPPTVDEPVVAAAPDGRRGWFLVTEPDEGETNLVHIRADGTVDPKWHPKTDGAVAAVARSGRRVFLAGDFTNVDGRRHARLAAVNARTGRAMAWSADVAGKKPRTTRTSRSST